MVVDQTAALIGAIITGMVGGFVSSWMSFNASGEDFNKRKHGNALITGAITGIVGGAIAFQVYPPQDAQQVIFLMVGILGSAIGIDKSRSNLSKMIANRVNEVAKEKEVKEGSSKPKPSSSSSPSS